MSDLNRFDDLRLGVNGDEKLPTNREERTSATSHQLKRDTDGSSSEYMSESKERIMERWRD